MIQPANLLIKKLQHTYFAVNLTKFSIFFFYPSLYRSPPANYDYICFAWFSEILVKWLKKLFEWFSSISETYLRRLSQSLSAYHYLKMLKFLQCYRQPGAPLKRSVPLVNDHPAVVDIFRKFFENGPCIQTIFLWLCRNQEIKLIFFKCSWIHLNREENSLERGYKQNVL